MRRFIFIILFFNIIFIYGEKYKESLIIGKVKGSETINQEISDFSKYTIVKSPIKNKKFGDIEKIEGEVIRSFYTVKDQSTYGIFKSYLKKLENEGFTVLFYGEKKELGEDFQDYLYELNPWDYDKNYEYSIPFKSGNENTQYFISAKKEKADKNIYVTINIITGFSKYPIYRVDIINTLAKIPTIENISVIKKNIMKKGKIDIYDIVFNKKKLLIDDRSKKVLELISEYIKSNKEKKFFIVGHTSNELKLEESIKLSENYAILVKDYLINDLGIDSKSIIYKGLGSLCPIFSNSSESGRRFNNRISLVLQ